MSTDYQDPKRPICLKHATKFHRNTRFNEKDRDLLRDYNLDEKEVAKYCSSVDFECMNRCFHGIGIRNLHNGLELFNDNEFVTPKTVGVSGLVVIVNTTSKQKRSCLMFMDFRDLLAYLTLRKHYPSVAMTTVPKMSDYIVLNELGNWKFLAERIKEYDRIFCFFQNTVVGGTLAKTINSLHEGKTIDYSTLYPGCKSLTDYLQLQKGRL